MVRSKPLLAVLQATFGPGQRRREVGLVLTQPGQPNEKPDQIPIGKRIRVIFCHLCDMGHIDRDVCLPLKRHHRLKSVSADRGQGSGQL
jgi:hypothetical protein